MYVFPFGRVYIFFLHKACPVIRDCEAVLSLGSECWTQESDVVFTAGTTT